MSNAVPAPASPEIAVPSIPVREFLPWLILGTLFTMIVILLLSATQGAVPYPDGTAIHEFVHDGRHLLGFPCH